MTPEIEIIYFLFAFLGMLYTFNKVGITSVSILFVLVFWEGLIDYLDTIYFDFFDFWVFRCEAGYPILPFVFLHLRIFVAKPPLP